MPEITARLWDELPAGILPGTGAFLALLDDPDNAWWDDRRTRDRVERRDDILSDALRAGYAAAVRAHGSPEAGGWRWSSVHRIDIDHLLGLPSLSARKASASRAGPPRSAPRASPAAPKGRVGAWWWSWVRPCGAGAPIPAGRAAIPPAPRYDDRLAEWTRGGLSALRFPPTATEIHASSRLVLRPLR